MYSIKWVEELLSIASSMGGDKCKFKDILK